MFLRNFSILTGSLLGVALLGCNSPTGSDMDGGRDAGQQELDSGHTDAGSTGTEDAGNVVQDAGIIEQDGGTERLCPPGAAFCEDFEDGLDMGRWAINGNQNTFTVDRSIGAAHGQQSLHVAYGATYGHTGTPTIQIKTRIAAPEDRLYARVYLRFDNLTLPGAHPFFISISDAATTEIGFGSIQNDFALMAWAPGGLDNPRMWFEGNGWRPGNEDGDNTPLSERFIQAKEWFCVEMMLFGDHQGAGDTHHEAEEAKVWLNGMEISDMAMSDTIWRQELGRNPPEHWSPVYDGSVWKFGIESFPPQNASIDVWFDALAISTQRIGCLP